MALYKVTRKYDSYLVSQSIMDQRIIFLRIREWRGFKWNQILNILFRIKLLSTDCCIFGGLIVFNTSIHLKNEKDKYKEFCGLYILQTYICQFLHKSKRQKYIPKCNTWN